MIKLLRESHWMLTAFCGFLLIALTVIFADIFIDIIGNFHKTYFTATVQKVNMRLVSKGIRQGKWLENEHQIHIRHLQTGLKELIAMRDEKYWDVNFNFPDTTVGLIEGRTYNFTVNGYGLGGVYSPHRNILAAEPYTERSSGHHSIRYELPPPVGIK